MCEYVCVCMCVCVSYIYIYILYNYILVCIVCIVLNGYEISFGGDENVLELDRSDGCTTLQMY